MQSLGVWADRTARAGCRCESGVCKFYQWDAAKRQTAGRVHIFVHCRRNNETCKKLHPSKTTIGFAVQCVINADQSIK